MRTAKHFVQYVATIAFAICTPLWLAGTAGAQDAPTEAKPAATKLSVELNKLEAKDTGCVAYMVLQNDTDSRFQSVKVDLVLFQTDGVIGGRYAIELAPLRAKKRSVKLFPLPKISCDQIGSLLINDVVDCKTDAGPVDDCLVGLSVKSLSNVELSK